MSLHSQRILAHITGKSLTQACFLKPSELTPSQQQEWQHKRRQLERGVPLDYILGEFEFVGHIFAIEPPLLVPREETEHWLHRFLHEHWLRDLTRQRTTLVDVGCGSGVIALTLAPYFKRVEAVDNDSVALRLTRFNAQQIYSRYTPNSQRPYSKIDSKQELLYDYRFSPHFSENTQDFTLEESLRKCPTSSRIRLTTWYSDMLQNPKLRRKLSHHPWILVANLPYLPHRSATYNTYYENPQALFSGRDGLQHTRRLLFQIKKFRLTPQALLLELDPRNIYRAADLLARYLSLTSCRIYHDYYNKPRILTVRIAW